MMQTIDIRLAIVTLCCSLVCHASGADPQDVADARVKAIVPNSTDSGDEPAASIQEDSESDGAILPSTDKDLLPPATDDQARSWVVALCGLVGVIATSIPAMFRVLARRRGRGVDDYLRRSERPRISAATSFASQLAKQQFPSNPQTSQPLSPRDGQVA